MVPLSRMHRQCNSGGEANDSLAGMVRRPLIFACRPRFSACHTLLFASRPLLFALACLGPVSFCHAVGQTSATPDAPSQPGLTAAQTAPLNPALPTIFVVGDSTARNKEDLGWGDHFAHYFDTARVNVANRARAGRSSRTFINEGAWDGVLKEMKAGDFVLIQMGHNDGGDLGGAKPRGTLKGGGDETKDVVQQDGHTETVHTYGWYLRKYIADTRAKGATPILLTVTIRNIWKPGADGAPHIERDMGVRAFEEQVGAAERVPVVDMATVAADGFEAMGPEKTATYFPIDHTHTSAAGAELNAQSVVTALRRAGSPVISYMKAE
jgi:rhamnogalacturonan acetylesterase